MRFGVFEVDVVAGELRKQGKRVRLQEQPFQVLCALLEHPGEVVTREQLQQRLWPAGVHVDFERGVNKAVLKLRDALGDTADSPRYIETLPRRGYRFVAPVHAEAAAAEDAVAPALRAARPRYRNAALALLLLVAGLVVLRALRRQAARAPEPPLVQFTVGLPPGLGLSVYDSSSVAFSRDGKRLALAARGGEGDGVYVRSLDGLDAVRLPGTERARSVFFSSDGQWIGFEAGEKLRRVGVIGGTPQALCEMPFPTGAADLPDGSVVLVPSFTGGLFRLPKPGARLLRLTTPDARRGERAHIWPRALPDGRGVLFTVWTGGRSFDQAAVAVLPPNSPWRVVLEGGYQAAYAPSGHLVFVRGGSLHAAPFDLDRLAVTGAAVAVQPSVATDASTGAALFDVSPTGSLAYAPGGAHTPRRRLVWIEPSGTARPVREEARPYLSPRVSPDGRRLALWIEDAEADVWLFDGGRDALTRLTSSGDNHSPAWSPDGRSLAFESGRDFVHHLFVRDTEGSGAERQLTRGDHHHYLGDFSPDGRWLAYTEFHPETGADVWAIGVEDGRARPVARSTFSEREAAFSPDVRSIAYVSDESGQREVYVQPFPGPGARVQVSVGGGDEPAWSRRGDEIVFRSGRRFLSVRLRPGASAAAGKPRVLFEGDYHDNIAPTRSYDVAADGRFVAVVDPPVLELPREVRVIVNWSDMLGRRTGRP
jgi:serine/threonine-protein kinase